MKFIHASDFHLFKSMDSSKLPAYAASEYRKDMFSVFKEVILRAKDADILLIPGDLIEEGCARPAEVKRVFELIESIPETSVFLSCGNHDPLNEGSSYRLFRLPDNLYIFPPKLSSVHMKDKNTRIWGFSWDRGRYETLPFSWPELNKDEINILCIHGDLAPKSAYMSISAADILAAGFDYAALGHIHKPRRASDRIFYSGSAAALDFSEGNSHGFISGDITKEKLSVEFNAVNIRAFVNLEFDVSKLHSHEDIVTAVLAQLKEPQRDLVRVKLVGLRGEGLDMRIVEEDLKEKCFCIFVEDSTLPDYDLDALYEENRDNIIGRFIKKYRSADSQDDKASEVLYAGLNALLSEGKAAEK